MTNTVAETEYPEMETEKIADDKVIVPSESLLSSKTEPRHWGIKSIAGVLQILNLILWLLIATVDALMVSWAGLPPFLFGYYPECILDIMLFFLINAVFILVLV